MPDKDLIGDRTLYPSEEESGPQRTGDGDNDRPLAINELFSSKSRRGLIDYFMTGDIAEGGENQSQIAEKSNVSRNSVGRHINTLVDFGLVEEKGDGAIRKYAPKEESDAYQLIVQCNELLAHEWMQSQD